MSMPLLKNTPETPRKRRFLLFSACQLSKEEFTIALKEVLDYISARGPDLAKAVG